MGSLQDELAGQTLRTMCKRFSSVREVWLLHLQHLIRHGKEEARKLVYDRALHVLPPKEAVQVAAASRSSPSTFLFLQRTAMSHEITIFFVCSLFLGARAPTPSYVLRVSPFEEARVSYAAPYVTTAARWICLA